MRVLTRIVAVPATVIGLWAGCVGIANAAVYKYVATVTLCTGTCESFASLDVGTQITGTIEINNGAGGAWTNADIAGFNYEVFNPAAPMEAYDGSNAPTANPLPLAVDIAPIRDAGGTPLGSVTTAGTAGAAGELNDGDMFHEFIVPPFNSNSAWVIFDLTAGTGKVCLFYSTAGCIPGATESVNFTGTFTRLEDTSVAGVGDISANGVGEVVFAATDFSTPPQGTVIDLNHPSNPVSANAIGANANAVPEQIASFTYLPPGRGIENMGLATMNVNYAAGGPTWVYLTDAASGSLLGKMPFLSSAYRALEMSVDLDASTPARPRVGLLMQDRSTGKALVHTRDFANNARTTTQFFNPSWDPVGMVSFPGLGTAGQTTIGVVGVAQSNGRIRLDLINVDGGGATSSFTIKNLNWSAVGVTGFRHVTSGPGSRGGAVLVTNEAGRIDAAIVDVTPPGIMRGAPLPAAITFLSSAYDPLAIATVEAYAGNSGQDALAVLGRNRATGNARVQVKDINTGTLLATADYLPEPYDKLDLVVVPDTNGNLSPEIGVLGRDATLPTRVHFRDSSTGAFVRHVFAP